MSRKRFSPQFERDYQFYLSNINVFTFAGSDIKKDFGIQLPGELEEVVEEDGEQVTIPFAIPYSSTDKNAKVCFWTLDTHGKKIPCSEPQLLIALLTCKAALNLQIKTWAQSRAEYTLSIFELQEYMDFYSAPEWVLKAVENQKQKIIKQWILDKKYLEHGFYLDALALHLSEHIK